MFSNHDLRILRPLAQRVAEIASLPIQSERISEWKRHNDLHAGRAMLLVFPEGSWNELLPGGALSEHPLARGIELDLQKRIYGHENFDSDNVVDATLALPAVVHSTGWGLEPEWKHSGVSGGARGFSPVLRERSDLERLHAPTLSYDPAASQASLEAVRAAVGDLLNVKPVGTSHISYHLMAQYTALRGLGQAMEDFLEDPDFVHEALEIFTEGHLSELRQLRALNLLSLNNDNSYHSTGGVGYSDALLGPDTDPGHVRPEDMWSSAESQELAQVSPKMHREFALDYEKRLLAPFARAGYGCCEALDHKLADVLALPNIWRISISPFANVPVCAPQVGQRAIFSWKPHPAHLVGTFDAEAVRTYLRRNLETAKAHDCVLEVILKDTHTCESHPERFQAWTRIAREEIRRAFPD